MNHFVMYIFFFTRVTVSNRKTARISSAFLRFSRNTDIECCIVLCSIDVLQCLDTALKFLTAKIVMLEVKFDFQCLSIEPWSI